MKIAILLSGGVDSSLALMTLKKESPQDKLSAYYLKIWLEDELASGASCPWEEDLFYARAVCDKAGIPLKVISLQQEYRERVVAYTLAELKAGRSPSPDIFCNRWIKFDAFLNRLDQSVDKVATGHYACITQGSDGLYQLSRSPDPIKDQTYFLSHITQEQASLLLFPIGGMKKEAVRAHASKWNLPNKMRKDSQGICFLGKIKYNDFVRYYLGEKSGSIVDQESGKKIGTHKGIWFHTIGQRRGLGLSGGPWYVVAKNVEENILYVALSPLAEARARREFFVAKPHWIAQAPSGKNLSVKLRHGPAIVGAQLTFPPRKEGEKEYGKVILDKKDRGIAAGQFTVFYEDSLCLGGAMVL